MGGTPQLEGSLKICQSLLSIEMRLLVGVARALQGVDNVKLVATGSGGGDFLSLIEFSFAPASGIQGHWDQRPWASFSNAGIFERSVEHRSQQWTQMAFLLIFKAAHDFPGQACGFEGSDGKVEGQIATSAVGTLKRGDRGVDHSSK